MLVQEAGAVAFVAKKMQRPVVVVDTSGLQDAHWAQINTLLRAFKEGGEKAFWFAALDLAEKDPINYLVVLGSFFPKEVREGLKDGAADIGMSEEYIRELQRKLQQKLDDDSGVRH